MKVLNFFYLIIALALMSFSPMQEPKMSHTANSVSYYVVLEVTHQDIEGDHFYISDVIRVKTSNKLDAKSTAVTNFENELHQRFPQGIFDVNNQSIMGVYNIKFKAEQARMTAISKHKETEISFVPCAMD